MKLQTLVSAVTLSFVLIAAPAVYAKACKGLSKTACSNSNSCSWTKGYTTKKGVKVDSYCRNKPGKKASKKSASSQKKETKKSSSNTKK